MANIRVLEESLRLIVSDRALERRKYVSVTTSQLEKLDIIHILDANLTNGKGTSWNEVFNQVEIGFFKEDDHSSGGKLGEANIRPFLNLLKLTVSKANARGKARLKVLRLVNHFHTIFQRDGTWSRFATDYTKLFQKEIVENRFVLREIPSEAFKDFLEFFIDVYEKGRNGIDHVLLLQVIRELAKFGCKCTTFDTPRLFNFFTEVINSCRKQKMAPSQQECLMNCCLTFCRCLAADCRLGLCRLGEGVFPTILMLLKERSTRYKDLLIRFLKLQLSCHHPRGVITTDEGMMAADEKVWRRQLLELCEWCLERLNIPSTGGRMFSMKTSLLSQEELDLFVDVFNQVGTCTSTDNMELDDDDNVTYSNKRAKKELFGPGVLIDKVYSMVNDLESGVVWLQVLHAMLERYPKSICSSASVFCDLTAALYQLQSNCRRYEIMALIMNCFKGLLHAVKVNGFVLKSVDTWLKIYGITLRTVSLKHCVKEGFALICEIINSRIIRRSKELLDLFHVDISNVNGDSLLALESIVCGGLLENEESTAIDQRLTLLNWLLPSPTTETMEASQSTSVKLNVVCGEFPILMGEVAFRLILADQNDFTSVKPPACDDVGDLRNFYASLENDYLRFYRLRSPQLNLSDVSNNTQTEYDLKPSTLRSLSEKLLELLLRNCGYLLASSSEQQANQLVPVLSCCVMTVTCLALFLRHKLMSERQLARNRLCEVLQNLLESVPGLLLLVTKDKSINTNVMSNVIYLEQLYHWVGPPSFCEKMTQFCREMTPESLVKCLQDLVFCKVYEKSSIPNLANKDGASIEDFKLLDQLSLLLVDANIMSCVPNWRLKVSVVNMLGHLCRYAPALDVSKWNTTPSHIIRTSLLDRLLDNFDLEQIDNVLIAVVVMCELLHPCQQMTDSEKEKFLTLLKTVSQLHFKDPDLSAYFLNLMAVYIKRLDIGRYQEIRTRVSTFVKIFWKLKTKGKCGWSTELALGNLFVSQLPHEESSSNDPSTLQDDSIVNPFCLMELLASSYRAVASFAAEHISNLFMGDISCSETERRHLKNLKNICQIIKQGTEKYENLSMEWNNSDVLRNWTTSSVVALVNIAACSSHCLKPVFVALWNLLIHIPSSLSMVNLGIVHLSQFLGYPSKMDFFRSHLPHLFYKLIAGGSYNLDNRLVCSLTTSNSLREFYEINYKSIVPLLYVSTANQSTIEEICRHIGRPVKDVVEECFPAIVAGYILPGLAVRHHSGTITEEAIPDVNTDASVDYMKRLCGTLTQEKVNRLMTSRRNELVVNVLRCLYIGTTDNNSKRLIPKPNPPYYGPCTVELVLEYLTATYYEDETIVKVLYQNQNAFQEIFLRLETFINQSFVPGEIFGATVVYYTAVKMILEDFDTSLNSGWAFILQDIIHTTVNHIKIFSNSSSLSEVTLKWCQLLNDIIAEVANIHTVAPELKKYFILIVNCLVELVQINSCKIVVSQALATLSLIVIETGELYENILRFLEPFPKRPEFDKLAQRLDKIQSLNSDRTTFLERIALMLERWDACRCNIRCEGLQQLRRELHSNRNKICQLVGEIKDLRFSSECSKKNIHRLIRRLVHFCFDSSSNENVAFEAALCLGEIGPVSLSTSVIEWEEDFQSPWLIPAKVVPEFQRYHFIFFKLHSYLLGSSIQDKRLAGETLKLLLATNTGQQFIQKYKTSGVGQLHNYLQPFLNQKVDLVMYQSQVLVDSPDIWCPEIPCSFEEWICKLTTVLLVYDGDSCAIFSNLAPICRYKVDFCESFFPFFIHAILTDDDGNFQRRSAISRNINNFIEKSTRQRMHSVSSTPSSSVSGSDSSTLEMKNMIFHNKRAVNIILEVVKYLRLQPRTAKHLNDRKWNEYDNNFWLDLDYLLLAEAAYRNKANLTALMYAEIWWNDNCGSLTTVRNQSGTGESCSLTDETNFKNFQDLTLKIYQCMGDTDAKSGCGTGHLSRLKDRLEHYQQEGRWDRALTTYNLMIRTHSNLNFVSTNLSKLTFNMGLDGIGGVLNFEKQNGDFSEEYDYESAWRLAQWSLPVLEHKESVASFEKAIYSSFVAFRDANQGRFTFSTRQGYMSVIREFGDESFETTGSLYKLLSRFTALNHLNECYQLRTKNEDEKLSDVIRSWSSIDQLYERNYKIKDLILSAETTALRAWCLAEGANSRVAKETICRLEERVKLAKENGRLQWAETYLSDLRNIGGTNLERLRWRLEDYKIIWDNNERSTAKGLLHSLIKDINKSENTFESDLAANCFFYFGLWSMELRLENASIILTDYLEKAINIWKTCEQSTVIKAQLIDAYLTAGRFADLHYQRVSAYKKSDIFETKRNVIVSTQTAVNKMVVVDKVQNKVKHTLTGQISIDKSEVHKAEETHRNFLLKSLEYYLECLRLGNEHDTRIFRIVALWNENHSLDEVNNIIQAMIGYVPSFKFLPLVRQLSARMKPTGLTNAGLTFYEVLDKLLFKVSEDHPYHTLLHLLALSNASKDDKFVAVKRRSSRGVKDEEARVLAAQGILGRLKKLKKLTNIIASMEKVSDALITFSYWDDERHTAGSKYNIDKSQPITKLKSLDRVPPFTSSVPVDPTGRYDNIVGIEKYRPYYKQCGGVNRPKQVWCLASDGRESVELVKGKDDLRQDAVMQQVFEMVNTMLRSNKETSRRGLLMRTYKVVPLSRRSGILEWCSPTCPIGEIIASDAFRKKYDLTAWPVMRCRRNLEEARTRKGGEGDGRYQAYVDICKNLKPVFRYFFFEKFPRPSTWYDKRLAYVKSVATSSIVGYILGLGDRHVSNILIDLITAEVIHIDLGVAFEEGRTLRVPETVPFRLTRDLVDGMGAYGCEGTFRRCCEHTLSVMKDSHEVILTILEVLLYDPLYQWTLTPLQMQKLQDTLEFGSDEDAELNSMTERGDGDGINRLAERVLHRMKEKLTGQEDATILSVDGQISHVIREATDERNLCLIYCGWQPFL